MSIVGTISIPSDNIKIRWKEPFASAGMNRKAQGTILRGIYRGFTAGTPGGVTITLSPDGPKTGTGNSVTAVSGTTQVLISSAPIFGPEDAAQQITISGMGNANNNGTFVVSRFLNPSRIEFQNAQVGAAAETSAFTWSLAPFSQDSVAVLDDPIDAFTTTVRYDSVVTIISSGLVLPLSVVPQQGSGSVSSITAPDASGLQILTQGVAAWQAADVGRRITITGATAGNNGTFTITRIVDPTPSARIEYFNPNGVVQGAAAGTWTVAHPHWVLLDVDYRQGINTSGAFRVVNSVGDLAAQPHALRICRIDIPINASALASNMIVQAHDADTIDIDSTTRPWASDVKKGFAFPGYRVRSSLTAIDFSGLGAVTQVTLSGRFYVGHGTTGTANQYFAFAQQLSGASGAIQLLGSNRNPITVLRVVNPVTSTEVNPALDPEVDPFGFILNPIVVADFSLVTEVDFSATNPRVYTYKFSTVGALTSDQTSVPPVRGFQRPARDVPVRGDQFIHIPTSTANVQTALNALDGILTSFGHSLVTVGPPGSFADFTGSTDAVFTSAITSIAANGGWLIVLPGTYTFGAAVAVSNNIRISGLVTAEHRLASSPVVINMTNAWTGAAFALTASDNVTLENLRITDSRTIAATAALVTAQISVPALAVEGPKFNNVDFATTLHSAGALALTTIAAAGANFNNVLINRCRFDTSSLNSGSGTVVALLDDLASFDIRDCTFAATTIQSAPVFKLASVNYTGRMRGNFERNHFEGSIGAGGGQWLDLTITGLAGDDSHVLIADNDFTSSNTNPTSALGMIRLNAITVNDSTANSIVFRNNSLKLTPGAGNTWLVLTDGEPGALILQGNTFRCSAFVGAFLVQANICDASGNKITTGVTVASPGALFGTCGTLRFIDNYVEYVASAFGATPSFPPHTIISNNYFLWSVVGANTGFILQSDTQFIGNTMDMLASTSGDAALFLTDFVLPSAQRIIISNNRVLFPSTQNINFISGEFAVNTNSSIISGNKIQDCKNFIIFHDSDLTDSTVSNNMVVGLFGAIICDWHFASTSNRNTIAGNNFKYNNSSAIGDAHIGIIVGSGSTVTGNLLTLFTGTVTAGAPVAATYGCVGIYCAGGTVSGNEISFMDVLVRGIVSAGTTISGNDITSIGSGVHVAVSGAHGEAIAQIFGSATGNNIANINLSNTGAATDVAGIYGPGDINVTATGNVITSLTPQGAGTNIGVNYTGSTFSVVVGNVLHGGGTSQVGAAVAANNA